MINSIGVEEIKFFIRLISLSLSLSLSLSRETNNMYLYIQKQYEREYYTYGTYAI